MPVSSVSVWSSGHKEKRPHLVEDIQFAEPGQVPWVRCDCGWEASGPKDEDIERAYWQHRRGLGLHAEIMSIGTTHWSWRDA
jgi:hypothetical protein